MDSKQIFDLTHQLTRALDIHYNVVNMEAVLAVISALERTPVTREQLLATRLARHINQLRQQIKSSNEGLAKRAKLLLKKWRSMLNISDSAGDPKQMHGSEIESFNVSYGSKSSTTGPNTEQRHNVDKLNNLKRGLEQIRPNVQNAVAASLSNAPQVMLNRQNAYTGVTNDTLSNNAILPISKLKSQEFKSSDLNKKAFDNQLQSFTKTGGRATSLDTVPSFAVSRPTTMCTNTIVIDSSDSDEESTKKSQHSLSQPFIKHDFVTLSHTAAKRDPTALSKFGTNVQGAGIPGLSNTSEIHAISNSPVSFNFPSSSHKTTPLSRNNSAVDLTFTGKITAQKTPISDNRVIFEKNVDNQFSRMPEQKPCIAELPNNSKRVIRSQDNRIPIEVVDITKSSDNSKSVLAKVPRKIQIDATQSLPVRLEQNDSVTKEAPKKRGRKKGSKGIDSVISNETHLSQQLFLGSGLKKVKTTQEILEDLKNRKTGFNIANLPLQNAPNLQTTPRSAQLSGSTILSLDNSQGNVTPSGQKKGGNIAVEEEQGIFIPDSETDSQTSEQTIGSVRSEGRCENIQDSNTDSQTAASVCAIDPEIVEKDSYQELQAKLQNVFNNLPKPLSVPEIEEQYRAKCIPCTCRIITEFTDDLQTEDEKHEEIKEEDQMTNLVKIESNGNSTNESKIKKFESNSNNQSKKPANRHFEIPKIEKKKPVKSIFDLDFDDVESTTQILYSNENSSAPVVKSELDTNENELIRNSGDMHQNNYNDSIKKESPKAEIFTAEPPEAEDNPVITRPAFRVIEDPDCKAKQRFEIQNQKICEFHVNALHNYCIPNVNGNWDDTVKQITDKCNPFEKSNYEVCDGSDVVPPFSSIVNSLFPKNLSNYKFEPRHIYKKPNSNESCTRSIFLGSAETLPAYQHYKQMLKSNDEYEDEDNECNLSNKYLAQLNKRKISCDSDQSSSNSSHKRLKLVDSSKAETLLNNFSNEENANANEDEDEDLLSASIYEYNYNQNSEEHLQNSKMNSTFECTIVPSKNVGSPRNAFGSVNKRNKVKTEVSDVTSFVIDQSSVYQTAESFKGNSSLEVDENEEMELINKLFFNDEICYPDMWGRNHCIFGDKYCNLISANKSHQKPLEQLKDTVKQSINKNVSNHVVAIKRESQSQSPTSNSEHINDNDNDNDNDDNESNASELDSFTKTEAAPDNKLEERVLELEALPADNNGLLPSFNHITDTSVSEHLDDTLCEYKTGFRILDENNKNKYQEFKEWQEVVHLRSYNNELLTVLPYVVLGV